MRLIVVGSGGKGREWLDVASRRRNVEIVAVVESAANTGEPALRLPGRAIRLASLEKAFELQADAAILASPPAVRARQAIQALNAGLGVLIETPVAASLTEAAEVFDFGRRVNKPVIVARSSRFGWAQGRLRDFVRQGRLGRITHVSVSDRRKAASENGWTTEVEHVQLLDRGVDQFDGLRSVLGLNAVSLMTETRKAPWSPYRHGSTTQSMIEMEQGVHVQYHGSLTAGRNEYETWLEGEKGVLWTDERIIWWRKRGWPRFIPLVVRRPRVSPQQTQRVLLEELKSALQTAATQPDGLEDTLRTIAMLEAAVRSDRDSRPVKVAEVMGDRAS
ncbi:MAG: gfo/Idh/MocA family oxidoreductase [Acidobacteria bacterium]|nr:MAG: gfo/Idh/MocA family oxidoreductase [Acidobacteriota bacterium]